MPCFRRLKFPVVVACLFGAALLPLGASAVKLAAARQRPTVASGEVIVRFRPDAAIGAVDAQLVRLGVEGLNLKDARDVVPPTQLVRMTNVEHTSGGALMPMPLHAATCGRQRPASPVIAPA